MSTTKVTFQLRKDTLVNWTSKNPVLRLGEPGFAIDTYCLKIGDGQTDWNNLPNVGDPVLLAKLNNKIELLEARIAALEKAAPQQ